MSHEQRAAAATFSRGHVSRGTAVDVARGVIGVTSDARLQEHVSSCPACAGKIATWTRMAAMAERERRLELPETAVARVKVLAEQRRPVSILTALEAAMGYDGALAPVPAGLRGQYLPDQVAYEAEGVAVDLRVSQESAAQMVIVGQLSQPGPPRRRLADVPVALVEDDEVRVRVLSNAWGEFHLEHPKADGLRLEVDLPGGRVVRIPLRRQRSRS